MDKMEIEMSVIHCANCGMPFAITKDKEERLRKCHNTFYCPSGHPQGFIEKTEEDRLRERVRAFESAEAERRNALLKRKIGKKTVKKKK